MNVNALFKKKSGQEPEEPDARPADGSEEPWELVESEADGEPADTAEDASEESSESPAKDTAGARKRARLRTARKAAAAAVPAVRVSDPRLRWAAFNATAAAAGHLVVWELTGDPMAGADFMARMTISVPQLAATAITAGVAFAGWKGAALIHLHKLPGVFGVAARPAAAVGAALWGQGTAPLVADGMAAIEPWGSILAPLLAAGPVAAGCWWVLDRRARQAAPPVRWLARIPLSTVAVSSLLYAPGVLL
ncbi:hypothetical protein ACF1FX_34570 [Streptomyces sp. NPDC014646]|uniref:hypothetical protein n=1 Tax=Streptomyces sp. NPDC014646 TaxID=3364877 RepID=UPI0036F74080